MRHACPSSSPGVRAAPQPASASVTATMATLSRILTRRARVEQRLGGLLGKSVCLLPAALAQQDPAKRPVTSHHPQQRINGKRVTEQDHPPGAEAAFPPCIDGDGEEHGEGECEPVPVKYDARVGELQPDVR